MTVVAITGISRGLGAALLAAASSRFDCILALGRGARSVAGTGGRCPVVSLEVDLSDHGALTRIDLSAVEPLAMCRELTLILNAAVIEPLGSAGNIPADEFRIALDVNFCSGVELVKAAFSASVQFGFRLHVVNITSGAATHPIAGWSCYCASKAAMKMWLDCFALDHGGVKVEHIDPGLLDTAMQAQIRAYRDSETVPFAAYLRDAHRDQKLREPAVVANEIIERIAKQ